MVRSVAAAIAGLGLLGACAQAVNDPLAVAGIYPGLAPNPVYRGELPRVLYAAEDTPANQGLLYTSMHDSSAAGQYASLAVAAEAPSDMRSALGEVLYAIDPDTAPAWGPKSTGIVSGWAGTGYGAARATAEMATAIQQGLASDGSAALKQYGPDAVACAENTLRRADRVVALTQEALAEPTEQPALLQQIYDVAQHMLRGSDAGLDPATCGLEEARRVLDPLALSEGEGG